MTYKITLEINPTPEDIQILGDGLMAYATQQRDLPPITLFAFFLRDENKQIVGGCNGANLYGCLHIDQLWISPALRGKSHGTQLMLAAENHGKEIGCTFAVVNTMDWEARGFYEKLGYQVEFERHGFLKNAIFYFLRKSLI
jgi:ribosomal protein S18 acetylase RimI-like enzyme